MKGKKIPLTKKELKSHQDEKVSYICGICGKRILKKFSKSINYWKVRDHCNYTGKYIGVGHSACNSEIPVVFHNGLNYDYHFIIKELANEIKGKFQYLGEHTEKYKTFFVLIEKQSIKIDKDGDESVMEIIILR